MPKIATPKVSPCFNIIHHSGELSEATTLDGDKVFRHKEIFIPEYNDLVLCAPDQDHFIYEEVTKKSGRPSYLCTCGSMAVIVGPESHKRFSSLTRKMLICYTYLLYGKHNTSLIQANYGHH